MIEEDSILSTGAKNSPGEPVPRLVRELQEHRILFVEDLALRQPDSVVHSLQPEVSEKALQQASETGRKQRKSENEKRQNPLEFQRLPILAAQYNERQCTSLESNDSTESITAQEGCDASVVNALHSVAERDSDDSVKGLWQVCAAWLLLPDSMRQQILRIVNRSLNVGESGGNIVNRENGQ